VKQLHKRFPNLRLVYLSSRIYAGYATGPLNPEPYAFEGAFSVRWLIRDQDKNGPVLLWGPYLWADGQTARKSDGLHYERADLALMAPIHLSPAARKSPTSFAILQDRRNCQPWFKKP